ncbi:MAG: hypothetical protein GWN93_26985 [Deltaproteobacteria bacterium]|nr:hypothetical protein [Deltaproteobacteria bacterium]
MSEKVISPEHETEEYLNDVLPEHVVCEGRNIKGGTLMKIAEPAIFEARVAEYINNMVVEGIWRIAYNRGYGNIYICKADPSEAASRKKSESDVIDSLVDFAEYVLGQWRGKYCSGPTYSQVMEAEKVLEKLKKHRTKYNPSDES